MISMTVEAFILVKAVPGNEDEVVRQLAAANSKNAKAFNIKGMKDVYRTTGEWDAVAIVEANNLKEISAIEDSIQDFEKEGKPAGYIVSRTSVLPGGHKQIGDP